MTTKRVRNLLLMSLASFALLFGTACKPRAWIEARPLNPRTTDPMAFTVTAQDGDGVAEIKIKVNGSLVKTCTNSSTCTFMGGPYPAYDQSVVFYEATVKDTKGFLKQVGPYLTAIGRPWQNEIWIPVRGSSLAAPDAIDICFAGDGSYANDTDGLLSDIADKIYDNYFVTDGIKDNERKYKFFYTAVPTSTASCGANVITGALLANGSHCNAVAVLHKATMQDCSIGNIFTAEGSETKAFVHETGHAVFGLADEYEGNTSYFLPIPFANIWPDIGPNVGKQLCEANVSSYGGDPTLCDEFCDNPIFCGFDWWRYGTSITMMVNGDSSDKWGLPARKRVDWTHGKY